MPAPAMSLAKLLRLGRLSIRPASRVRLSSTVTRPYQSITFDGQTNVGSPVFMWVSAIRNNPPISLGLPLILEDARSLASPRSVCTYNGGQ
jgi:hypothetical protein